MLSIIKNQRSEYYIVNNKDASVCERFAASELEKYLYLSTNCPLPIYSDKCDKYGKEIIIGRARGNIKDERLNNLSDEAFIIKEAGDDLIIDGNSF